MISKTSYVLWCEQDFTDDKEKSLTAVASLHYSTFIFID